MAVVDPQVTCETAGASAETRVSRVYWENSPGGDVRTMLCCHRNALATSEPALASVSVLIGLKVHLSARSKRRLTT